MNNDKLETHGGVNIRPSARKSIHSHCNVGHHKIMGKYGLNVNNRKREEKSEPTLQDQGVDEVDNVMSKMARPASPVPTRKNNNVIHRRNSFEISNNEYSDEDSDDENILSKSSPATLSCYSEELYISALQNEFQRSRNESSHFNISTQRRESTSYNNRHNGSLNSSQSQEKNTTSILEKNNQITIAILILFLAVIVLLYKQHLGNPVKVNNVYDKFSFYNDVKDLKEKYKVKENSILQVRTGVATIFENKDTASFIFAYNSKSNNFNPIIFNNFIEDIAATTSRYLRNESKEVHVTVEPSDLIMQSVKDFMNHYQDGVDKTGVMLVKDIDNVPPQLAMAFHYYCDEYNPFVKQSAIFFTLNLANCSNNFDQKSTHNYIEKCLAKKWNAVGEEKIGPLLTRVVNIVVDVTQTF